MYGIKTLYRFPDQISSICEWLKLGFAECINLQIPWLENIYCQLFFSFLQKIILDRNNSLAYRLMKLNTIFRCIIKTIKLYKLIVTEIFESGIQGYFMTKT